MAEYFGVDNTTNRVVSGVWASDSPLPEGQRLEQITDGAQWGWEHDGTNWVVPTVSVDELRDKRDELLKSSDEMITRHREHEYLKANRSNTRFDGKDYGNIAGHLTESKYHDWLVYRQDLRDLPDGYTPVTDPTYPNKPS